MGVLAELRDQLEQLNNESEQMQKRKEKLDKELKDMRHTMEARQNEINTNKEIIASNAEHIAKLETDYKNEKHEIEQLNLSHESLESRKESLKKAIQEEVVASGKLGDDRTDLKAQCKSRDDEVAFLKNH